MNSVAPGFVRTNEATETQWFSYGADGQKALVERIAIKRLGTAQDTANAVVFFASELASFVNGGRCCRSTEGNRPSLPPVTRVRVAPAIARPFLPS